MSKAFTKEDDAPPDRFTRTRSRSGLPPGAVNYMTADGARRLRTELSELPATDTERAAAIESILAVASIVEPPAEPPKGAVFGATVEVRDPDGELRCFRIVGADEVNLEPHWVSWNSPIGKNLLGAEIGQCVILELDGECRKFTIVRIDY